MPLRRSGSPTAFWDGATTFNQATNPRGGLAVPAAGTSQAVLIPRGGESLALFIAVSGATTVTLEAAHHGANTSEGNEPDSKNPPATGSFYAVSYLNTPVSAVFAGAGTSCVLVADFAPGWIRLRSSQGPLTITAGYEVTGD
jgi:hypothetical protein